MSALLKHVEATLAAHGGVRQGRGLLVAVSGGVDSMVLLHVLHALSRQHRWRITVAHLNHRLRGRSSDADERCVARYAAKLHLPVVVERADVKQLAKAEKVSLEMAARKVRHEFLARTARRLRVRTVALAHHADDQLELFFLRLLRGSGSDGLAGMKGQGPSPADPGIQLIRPLLDQPKARLVQYAGENRIPFREDATNRSVDFQRNRIRHELLPLLRKNYQPALGRVIRRVMDLAGGEAEFLDHAASAWLALERRAAFKTLHPALQRRCLQHQLTRLGVAVDFERIETLRLNAGRPVSVGPEVSVVRRQDGQVCVLQTKPVPSPTERVEIRLRGRSGKLYFGTLQFQWTLVRTRGAALPAAGPGHEVFDADRVGASIVLRHWQPGDRFQPIGMGAPVKLQDLFTNNKIPREERSRLVVAATASGELFWVEKLRISERFKLSAGSIRRLLWVWKPL